MSALEEERLKVIQTVLDVLSVCLGSIVNSMLSLCPFPSVSLLLSIWPVPALISLLLVICESLYNPSIQRLYSSVIAYIAPVLSLCLAA